MWVLGTLNEELCGCWELLQEQVFFTAQLPLELQKQGGLFLVSGDLSHTDLLALEKGLPVHL